MSESTQQLAVTPQRQAVQAGERGLTFGSMDDMWRFCVAMVNSNQFKDINTPEVALLRLQAGMELGLTPIWSLTNIMITNGRPSVWGDALLGLVLSNPLCEDVIETSTGKFPDDTYTAVCDVRRKGRAPVVRTFSVADAKKAGIFGKNVHASYPTRMLQMRARAFACRDAFADSLRGLRVREELDDIPQAKVREVRPEATGLQFAGETPAIAAAAVERSDNDGPEIDEATGLAKEDLFK